MTTLSLPILRPIPQSQHFHHEHGTIKIIHLLRHAQGEHNVVGEVDYAAYSLEENEDACVSKLGITQCKDFSNSDKAKDLVRKCDLVVVSPMRRTIQTASLCFPYLIDKTPWLGIENVREQTGAHPCDRRRPINELSRYFPYIDFSDCQHDIDPLYPLYPNIREPLDDLITRGKQFITWLQSRPEKEIIVVSHSAFIRCLLTYCVQLDVEDTNDIKFNNCELRSYTIQWKL